MDFITTQIIKTLIFNTSKNTQYDEYVEEKVNTVIINYEKFAKFHIPLDSDSEIKEFANIIQEIINIIRNNLKHIFIHWGFDENLYFKRLDIFVFVIVLIKANSNIDIFNKENFDELENQFKIHFKNDSDALEEFKKFTDNNAFELCKTEKSPMDVITDLVINIFIFNSFEKFNELQMNMNELYEMFLQNQSICNKQI